MLVVMGFVGVCAAITLKWLKVESSQEYQDYKAGLPEWRLHELDLEARRAEARVEEGRAAIEADDPKGAYQALVDAKQLTDRYVRRWPDREFRPGVTLSEWFMRLESQYFNDMAVYFDRIIERVKESDFDVRAADVMARDFAFYGFDGLKEAWNSRHEEIAVARARAAGKWVRVTFSGNTDAFNPLIKKEIERKWRGAYGYRLVYGDAFDSREDKATWKTIAVRTHLVHASRRILDTREQALNDAMPRVPERVETRLVLVGATEIPTTWDELKPFQARVAPPGNVMLDPLLNQGARDAEGIIADRTMELKAAFTGVMETLPSFRLFPDVPPDTPLVDIDGRLRLEAAQSMLYEQREKAVPRFAELARDGNSFLREDICRAAISIGADFMGALVADILPGLDTLKQRRLIGLLKSNPGFGEFAPILSLLLRPKPDIYPEEAVEALKGHIHTPQVRETFLKLIHNPTVFRRHNYAMVFLQEIALEEVEILAPAWVASDDGRFALRVFETLAVRHPALAERLILTIFDEVEQTVQYAMLDHLRMDLAKADSTIIDLFKRNTQRKDASLIVDLAYESLSGIARSHRGWRVLRELEGVESDPNRQQLIKRALMTHVEYLFPDSARAFLLEQLKGEHREARNYAVGRLMERKDSKSEVLAIVAGMLRKKSDDNELIDAAVMGMHQNVRRGQGWDFEGSSDDLMTILIASWRHWNVQTRQYAYGVMEVIAQNGQSEFRQALADVRRREQNETLREEIDAMLKSLGEG